MACVGMMCEVDNLTCSGRYLQILKVVLLVAVVPPQRQNILLTSLETFSRRQTELVAELEKNTSTFGRALGLRHDGHVYTLVSF